MTDDGECRVYLLPFPGDVKAAVRLDQEGFPTIYINDYLSPKAKKKALLHELRHLKSDDFYSDRGIRDVESAADR